ncbi:MAG TPA: hypothetical protein VM260_20240 [Pirellula sp.]|nr:hypothetical protein [Pirellula sp.]
MSKCQPKSNHSQMQLEAMLYLLDDPALDRNAFEGRLANDSQLAETLAEAVPVFHSLQSVQFDSQSQSVSCLTHSSLYSHRRWQSILVIAASLLMVGFLGWQTLVSIRSRQSEVASASTENVSLNSVVWAWGELRADEPETQLVRDTGDFEYDHSLAMLDPFTVRDVPEWLVMATTDIHEGDNDQKDAKVLIQ